MVLNPGVKPLTKLEDDVGPFEVARMIDDFTKVVDILIDSSRPLEVSRSL